MARVAAALLKDVYSGHLACCGATSSSRAPPGSTFRGARVAPMQQYSEDWKWHLPSGQRTSCRHGWLNLCASASSPFLAASLAQQPWRIGHPTLLPRVRDGAWQPTGAFAATSKAGQRLNSGQTSLQPVVALVEPQRLPVSQDEVLGPVARG